MPNSTNRNPLTNWPGQTDSAIDPATGLPHGIWSKNALFRDLIDYETSFVPAKLIIELDDNFGIGDTIELLGVTITFYEDLSTMDNDPYGVSLSSNDTPEDQAYVIAHMFFGDFYASANGAIVTISEAEPGTQTMEEAVVTGSGSLLQNTTTEAKVHDEPIAFFVLANDILVARDAIFSLQEVLGVNPGISSLNPSITNLTDRLLYLESGEAFDARYDARYGGIPQALTYGVNWGAIYENSPAQRSKLTILGHIHDGVLNSKINLSNHVTGLLRLANLDTDGITGSNLWSNSSKVETIATALSNSFSLTSITQQTASGPLQVNNNFGSLLLKDLEIKDGILSGYTTSSDTGAWSGSSFIATTSVANGVFFRKALAKTKYWRYSIGLRSAVSNISSTAMVAKLIIKNTTTGATLKTLNIYPTMYNNTSYQIIYTDFIFNGTRPQESITVEVEWVGNGNGVTWRADSISIAPIHLSVYDI